MFMFAASKRAVLCASLLLGCQALGILKVHNRHQLRRLAGLRALPVPDMQPSAGIENRQSPSTQQQVHRSPQNVDQTEGSGNIFTDARDGDGAYTSEAKAKLLSKLREPKQIGGESAEDRSIEHLVDELCKLNPTKTGLSSQATASLAPGTWRVAHAPHIQRLSSVMGTFFDPITYVLREDGTISSYVRYDSTLAGKGFLSASGTFGAVGQKAATSPSSAEWSSLIAFDKFWWDRTARLRLEPPCINDEGTGAGGGGEFSSAIDTLVQSIGNTFFLPSLGVFPVSYLDDDLCIFRFPPLNVKITALRESSGDLMEELSQQL